ncbi:hypothetical protein LV716_08335 [Flagellimonas sp. HMM57]|uniref:hypothetical protein n=1 Tax=unclassified Flagellimonas TaxID=2644544 RepID=UPI0013D4F8AC|nr:MULTISPECIES: hypothetical protein [unclassified Flagellimonas]UII77762.1 hypothetical protein LV716_08335 [Flagellimonas sp. HMM57]
MIRLPYHTSKIGWNEKEQSLKKSAAINKTLDCDNINRILYNKLHDARSLIHELGDGIQHMDIDILINEIKTRWQDKISPQLKSKMPNGLMLSDWGKVIIERKRKLNKQGFVRFISGNMEAPYFSNILVPFLTLKLCVWILFRFYSVREEKRKIKSK